MRSPHTAMKSSPCSRQLEKARAQQQRPNAAKNKQIYFKKNQTVLVKVNSDLIVTQPNGQFLVFFYLTY